MKIKEALPDFDDTLWDVPQQKKKSSSQDFTKTPSAQGSQTLEIVVEPSGGAFRAMIKSVNDKPYGTSPIHPKEFLASGKTVADALIALAQKLK